MYDRNAIISGEQIDLGVRHHFSDDVYAKQMFLPKGHVALSHKHKYSHLSILSEGRCALSMQVGGIEKTEIYTAPACINIKAGVEHEVLALEDVVWFCIHKTKETDVTKIDEVLIEALPKTT